MTAYYNEIDPFAAAWLRELIKEGHIADGEVDETDIRDIRPTDLRGFDQCHFFAGIGVWSYALRLAGWPDDRPVWTGSCPCQPYSTAGRGKGFADERHLWPHWFHLIEICRPDAVFGEQVASKDGLAWLDLVSADLEGSDYAIGALDTCAAGFGALGEESPLIAQSRSALMEFADACPDPFIADEARSLADALLGVVDGSPHIRQRLYWFAERLVDGQRAGLEGFAGHGDRGDQPGRVEADAHGSIAEAGATGGLADPHVGNAGSKRQQDGGKLGLHEEDRGVVRSGYQGARAEPGGLANAPEQRWLRWRPSEESDQSSEIERPERFRAVERSRPPDADRRSPDWLFCRDGKWRPVESGTSPLAHGAPARVGRLRGYGNAINATQARAFIEAVMVSI